MKDNNDINTIYNLKKYVERIGGDLQTKRNWLIENDLFINLVWFPTDLRGQGLGTKIMREIIDYGNRTNTPITLEASSYEENTDFDLEDWYLRLGFEFQGGSGDYGLYMVKFPELRRTSVNAKKKTKKSRK